jgi:hypothetical protein
MSEPSARRREPPRRRHSRESTGVARGCADVAWRLWRGGRAGGHARRGSCSTGSSAPPSLVRMQANEAIVKRVLDDEGFREALMALYATRVYRRARGDDKKTTPGSGQ